MKLLLPFRAVIATLLIGTVGALRAQPAVAQTSPVSNAQPAHVDASLFAASEQPAIFPDLKVRTTDLIEASLSVENKGGSLTYAPLLYGLRSYRPLVSEFRLRVSQKDNLTTLGFGTQYNPLSPRGTRGTRLWNAHPSARANALRAAIGARMGEIEAKLKERRAEYGELHLPLDATAADKARIEARQAVLIEEVIALERDHTPLKAELAALDAADQEIVDQRIRDFYRGLLETRVPVIGLSYNLTLFPVLHGDTQDADGDALNDVERRAKKHAVSLSTDSRLSDRFQLSALVTAEWDRGAAEAGNNFARLRGAAFTIGGIVATLDSDYRTSKAYLESLFIPSIVLGASIEHRRCSNFADRSVTCPDKLQRLSVLTPFVDLKASKVAQFRIGSPIKWSKAVTGTGAIDIGVVTALNLQLGEPK